MSPRHNRRRRDGAAGPREPDAGTGWHQIEEWRDSEWMVRSVTGATSTKTYRCPGCDHEVRPGAAHVVAWPADLPGEGGLGQRRHWHRPCWNARDRRSPVMERSRNAPRYG